MVEAKAAAGTRVAALLPCASWKGAVEKTRDAERTRREEHLLDCDCDVQEFSYIDLISDMLPNRA